MDFLTDAWEGLGIASRWLLYTFKGHPAISVLVLGALIYGWCLEIRIKRGQLRNQKREEKEREREAKIDGYMRQIENLKSDSPMGIQSVEPGPGDDPELVKEAWRRYVNRKIQSHGPTLGKWKFP